MSDAAIETLRERIAEIDRGVVQAFNRRIELVAELKRLKEASGLGFLDLGRERRLLEHLAETNRGPLSEEGLRELHALVLDLTKREVLRGRDTRPPSSGDDLAEGA